MRLFPPTRLIRTSICLLTFVVVASPTFAKVAYQDRTFESKVFGGPRYCRIFLPLDYESSELRFPVIYYCHGFGDRYTLEHYDHGKDTVPKIAQFVADHRVIVVAMDGYVDEHYDGFYGGAPWDALKEGGDYDFGAYFLEMVAHIDANFRTLTSRRHRALSGLSMGGFMSFFLSSRYPQLVGSTSAFNPSPEFFVGDKGSRVLWQSKDHVTSHTHTMVRLIGASGDYMSQYHEETRAAYARTSEVDFEYRQDEYHRHWATSIGETFAFHLRAFDNQSLDESPPRFSHHNAYRSFDVWGYEVQVEGDYDQGFVYLTDVRPNSLRVTTRAWAPDGPAVDGSIKLSTPLLYQPGESYLISDLSFATGKTSWLQIKADSNGRIVLHTDGSGHHFGFNGPNIPPPQVVLLPETASDRLRLRPRSPHPLHLRVYNPADRPARGVDLTLSSDYPTVEWIGQSMTVAELGKGEVVESGESIQAKFVAGSGYFAPTRLNVALTADGQASQSLTLDILVTPEQLPSPDGIEILDGRTVTFSVFQQSGNRGGGKAINRTVTEGRGNGDGELQPGEDATIWVRTIQGLDPLDKNNWHRTKIYSESPSLVEFQEIQEQKQREWTGAKERTSVVRLGEDVPEGTQIPLLLSNETWSFHYTPDVRFGREFLYQAFQRHRFELHQVRLPVVNKRN